jgi:hypothetical protein
MSVRVPRLAPAGKAINVTCWMPADLHADLEAYAAAYQAHYGEAIRLLRLISAMVRDSLAKDRTFLRWRQEHEALPEHEEDRYRQVGTAPEAVEG